MKSLTGIDKAFLFCIMFLMLVGTVNALQLEKAPGVVVTHKIVPAVYWTFNDTGLDEWVPHLNSTGLTRYIDFSFSPYNATAWTVSGQINSTVLNYVKNCKLSPTQACVNKISAETGLSAAQLAAIDLTKFKTIAKSSGLTFSQAEFSMASGSFSALVNIPTWQSGLNFGFSDGVTNTTYLTTTDDCLIGSIRTYTSADSPVYAACNIFVNETGHLNITDVDFRLNLTSNNQYTFKSNGTVTAIRSNISRIGSTYSTSWLFNGTTTIINGSQIGTEGLGVMFSGKINLSQINNNPGNYYAIFIYNETNGTISNIFYRVSRYEYSTGPFNIVNLTNVQDGTWAGYLIDGAGHNLTFSGVSGHYEGWNLGNGGGNISTIGASTSTVGLGNGTWNFTGIKTAMGGSAATFSGPITAYVYSPFGLQYNIQLLGTWHIYNSVNVSHARTTAGTVFDFDCATNHSITTWTADLGNYRGCFRIDTFQYWYNGPNRTFPIKITTDGSTPKSGAVVKLYNATGSLENQATTGSDGLVNVSSKFANGYQAAPFDTAARNITVDDAYAGQVFFNSSTNGYVIYTVAAGGDTTKPLVTIQQPTNQWYSSAPPLNFTATDETAISACWYSLDNWAVNTTIASCANTTISGSAQGSNTVKIGVNDTSNNLNDTASATYSFDTLNPTVTINTPTNTTYYQNWVLLNFTASDSGIGLNTTECYYSLDNFANNASISCTTPLNITGFATGSHTINLTVRDLLNHYNNTESISFTTAMPYIIEQACIPGNDSLWLNFTTNAWIFNSTLNISASTINNATNGTYASFNKTGLTNDTLYYFNFTLRDDIGNSLISSQYNCTTTSNTIPPDTTPPSVTITNPANTTYATGDLTLETTITDANSGVNTSSCVYSLDAWASNTSFNCVIASITSLSDGAYNLKIAAADNVGNWNTTSQVSFTIALPPAAPAPTLTNQTCTPGVFSLSIFAEFNASAYNASLNYGINDSLGTILWNTISGTNMTFNPDALQDNTTYFYNFTSYNSTGDSLENGTFNCTTSEYVPPPPSTWDQDNALTFDMLVMSVAMIFALAAIGMMFEASPFILIAGMISVIIGVITMAAGILTATGSIITGADEVITFTLQADQFTTGYGLILAMTGLFALSAGTDILDKERADKKKDDFERTLDDLKE